MPNTLLPIPHHLQRSDGDCLAACAAMVLDHLDVPMTQTTVGIRELKARLSVYMQQVKAGATVVITERGKPIARIVPLSPSVETRVQELVQARLMAWSGRKLTPLAPLARTRGTQAVADLLIEDRE